MYKNEEMHCSKKKNFQIYKSHSYKYFMYLIFTNMMRNNVIMYKKDTQICNRPVSLNINYTKKDIKICIKIKMQYLCT